jgi:hypothetical protein
MLTKPRNAPRSSNTSMYAPNKRRRLSPLMIIGISVPLLLALIGVGVIVVLPHLNSHAAAAVPNPNCTIIVPANALSATGLATPYQLFAPDAAANGACAEANANQGAFVQATIYDPATGKFSIYSPLVIDKGTQPAVVPTAPVLPANAIVGLWFGFNGTNLTLQGTNAKTLANAKCVNGLKQSIFGQFAYCNAVNFFNNVNTGIKNGLVTVPPLGMAKDGLTCPTSRDFSVIDQDQSDNVQTQYLANGNGQTAQVTTANQALLANATTLGNPSDNALVTKFIDPTLGCTPWTAPDLANNNTPNLSLALDEIQANAFQQAPIALVPLTDPMTLNNAAASPQKTTLYRRGSDQTPVNANDAATNGSGTTYCQNMVGTAGLTRIKNDMTLTINGTSPAPAMANSLFTFLAMRFNQSYTNLGCQALLNNAPNPVALTLDGNGVVIAATITLPGTTTTTGTGTTTTQTATGLATINLDANAGNATLTLNVTYPNHTNAPVTVSIVDSAAAKTLFSQQLNTDNNSQTSLNSAINGLQGLTAIPNTWVFNVADPNMNNTIVGSGSVISNGATGTATLGTLTPAAAATTPAACTTGNAAAPATGNAAAVTPTVAAAPATGNAAAVTPTVAPATGNAAAVTPTVAATTAACTPGTTPAAPTVQPTAPASAGQVTPANAPYNKVAKKKHHLW